MLDGKIMELDEMISKAVIIEENQNVNSVCIGSTILLQEVNSGKEVRYTLVGPREVNPAKGKISGISPVGKAVLGKRPGDIFEVAVPAGRLQFQLKDIEHKPLKF
jgi:transcription elongation factor GreA